MEGVIFRPSSYGNSIVYKNSLYFAIPGVSSIKCCHVTPRRCCHVRMGRLGLVPFLLMENNQNIDLVPSKEYDGPPGKPGPQDVTFQKYL